MSSRKRGQAGREGPQGGELKMGIIHVTIQIVPINMISLVENMEKRVENGGQAGREGPQGRELKMGIIHVTIQIVTLI